MSSMRFLFDFVAVGDRARGETGASEPCDNETLHSLPITGVRISVLRGGAFRRSSPSLSLRLLLVSDSNIEGQSYPTPNNRMKIRLFTPFHTPLCVSILLSSQRLKIHAPPSVAAGVHVRPSKHTRTHAHAITHATASPDGKTKNRSQLGGMRL